MGAIKWIIAIIFVAGVVVTILFFKSCDLSTESEVTEDSINERLVNISEYPSITYEYQVLTNYK
jgi:hypothetical protein